jgi:flagellar biosynthesis anti-sigma factor FlgM
MKIEGTRPDLESVAAQETGRTGAGRAKDTPAGGRAQPTDRVAVSDDAALALTARRAAENAPDIRPDVVELMRAKLAAGKVGDDPVRLADRMIDHLLGS